MHKPESVLENKTHKLLWDFEIQTDHLISARQPGPCDSQQKEKKQRTSRTVEFDHKVKLKKKAKRRISI